MDQIVPVLNSLAHTDLYLRILNFCTQLFGESESIILGKEPLASCRDVAIRETKIDWAAEVARLLESRYADCQQVIVVCNNLNLHTNRAFYETFEPE